MNTQLPTESKFLVTGGAGFIGSNFVRKLVSLGYKVNVLDKLTYAGNLENLSSLDGNPHHHFIRGNIGDGSLVPEILKKYQINAVVNFAAESHVDRSIHESKDFIETNIVGTYNLLESARSYWNDLEKNLKEYPYLKDKIFKSITKLLTNSISENDQESIEIIKKAFGMDSPVRLIVNGEEDLLVLPVCIHAPENSIVLYGQPDQGLVLVHITTEIRNKAQTLLDLMI